MTSESLATKRTRIKFCGLVRPADIDVAVALGVEAIGFVFYAKSPRYVEFSAAAELRRRLPSWVSAVGLFVNESAQTVRDCSKTVGLDVVQFHGDETPVVCHDSLLATQPYWRAVRIQQRADLLNSWAAHRSAESFLLDTFSAGFGGSGEVFDWSVVPAKHGHSLIMSGGLDSRNVGDAIAALRPTGVDVSSGIQADDPRAKDAQKMEAFVSAVIRADEQALTRTS